jgi:hypothetical protein
MFDAKKTLSANQYPVAKLAIKKNVVICWCSKSKVWSSPMSGDFDAEHTATNRKHGYGFILPSNQSPKPNLTELDTASPGYICFILLCMFF